MTKGFILLFNLLGLFLCRLFFPSSVSIEQAAPLSAQINNSFLIQIAINKGDLNGVGKFTEHLPAGFIAVPIDKEGSKTSFDSNTIQFSWDSLPANEDILNISFRVDVDSSAAARTNLVTGRFLYTINNQKTETDCVPSSITITNGLIAQSTTNTTPGSEAPPISNMPQSNDTVQSNTALQNTNDVQSSNAQNNYQPVANSHELALDGGSHGVFAVRQFPSASIPPNSSAVITLTIHKAGITGFAKVEDSIPPGFTAIAINTNGASFTFLDNIVKFAWQNIPADSVITISYRMVAGANVNGIHVVSGNFSYINGTPVLCSIGSTIFNTTKAKPANNDVVQNTGPVNNPDDNMAASVTPSIPSPTTRINYRVQIMALHKPVDITYFSAKRKIKIHVNTEANEGYTKYTVGNYSDYKLGRNARESIKNNGIEGPFVVSYNAGVRITVQEALMISHQQWYK